jgi:SOS response regulatory protein OraA/RecX
MKKKIDSNHKYSNYMLKQKLFNYFLKLGYDTMMIEETFQSLQKKDNSIIEKEYNKIYNRLSKKYKDNELKMHIKSKLYQKGFDAGEISDLLSQL